MIEMITFGGCMTLAVLLIILLVKHAILYKKFKNLGTDYEREVKRLEEAVVSFRTLSNKYLETINQLCDEIDEINEEREKESE